MLWWSDAVRRCDSRWLLPFLRRQAAVSGMSKREQVLGKRKSQMTASYHGTVVLLEDVPNREGTAECRPIPSRTCGCKKRGVKRSCIKSWGDAQRQPANPGKVALREEDVAEPATKRNVSRVVSK